MIEPDFAALQAVALFQCFSFNSLLIEVGHGFEIGSINGPLVKTAIELVEGVFWAALVDVNDSGVDHGSDLGGSLAL